MEGQWTEFHDSSLPHDGQGQTTTAIWMKVRADVVCPLATSVAG